MSISPRFRIGEKKLQCAYGNNTASVGRSIRFILSFH